ncbi:hypothetical protein BDY17DRAFT_111980 [Neohortaea acidophila]|uniref:Uncharacterized protein n=1 Tax=Neohortaea acidophila TaxID=245834 RepID=A0A6A6Q1E2_9PEZI|nr:uncharacterized protein BDY17DRAFT_111980 [Neohortaea acidophila]KAF2485814.1 hypothetical protein BDY17DRAFT_111980 [Neohortaea acidophila]
MPRPTDHYTHSQFEPIASDFQGETVVCVHCKHWTGSVKTLNRKKEHLLKCPAYAAWRAAGNGQDLPPPNKYSKRDSFALNEPVEYAPAPTAVMGAFGEYAGAPASSGARNRALDVIKLFDEFWDDSSTQKCMRTRCKYCGFVRAKNSTRQYEHLQSCNEYLASSEGQQALADGLLTAPIDASRSTNANTGDIFNGAAPNPNLTFPEQIRGGKRVRLSNPAQSTSTPTRPPPPRKPSPSLVNHLLTQNRSSVEQSIQLPFLSHAGCGTLSRAALQQWLTQQSHLSRSLCTFIGTLIGKIRLNDAPNPSLDTSWRALDLLVSALNNAKRELDFLRSTHMKYGLQQDTDAPRPATRGMLDLFAAASAPAASLLEGLVILWAIEHLYSLSWHYASTFIQPVAPSSTSYTVPSYLQPPPNPYLPYNSTNNSTQQHPAQASNPDTSHTSALHEALIPNWTSLGFANFVDACKAIVDELANGQTAGNGAEQLRACDGAFMQVVWLWRQVWPEVTGMGEEEVLATADDAVGGERLNGDEAGRPIEVGDDEDDGVEVDAEGDVEEGEEEGDEVEASYADLRAVVAANRAG